MLRVILFHGASLVKYGGGSEEFLRVVLFHGASPSIGQSGTDRRAAWRAVPDCRRNKRRGCRGGRKILTAEAQRRGGKTLPQISQIAQISFPNLRSSAASADSQVFLGVLASWRLVQPRISLPCGKVCAGKGKASISLCTWLRHGKPGKFPIKASVGARPGRGRTARARWCR